MRGTTMPNYFDEIVDVATGERTIRQFTEEEIAAADAATANGVRIERTRLLKESDWTQVSDAPVDKAAWAEYRQDLRDITEQAGFPYSVVWPTKPN
jgi:hypothetical protein